MPSILSPGRYRNAARSDVIGNVALAGTANTGCQLPRHGPDAARAPSGQAAELFVVDDQLMRCSARTAGGAGWGSVALGSSQVALATGVVQVSAPSGPRVTVKLVCLARW